MASIGAVLETPDLSGNTWPIAHPAVGSGQSLLIFVGGWTRGAASQPSLSGVSGTIRFNDDFPDYYLRGALIEVTGNRSAGTITVNWSGSGCTGSAYAVVMNAGAFDIGSGVLIDPAQNIPTRTLGALTASESSSVRIEFIVTALTRELENPGMTVQSEATYHSGSTGGVGAGIGHKAVSAGSTNGSEWKLVDPDRPTELPAGASPSVGWTVIYKPDNSPTSPVISGTINAPDESATVPPIAPTQAPTVSVLGASSVNITGSGIDPTASTVLIGSRRIVNGVPSTNDPVQIWSAPVAGLSWPVKVDFLIPGATYQFSYWVEKDGIKSAASPESAPVTLMRSVIHFFTDPSAAGVSGVTAQVFGMPASNSPALVGAPLFTTTGLTFDQALYNGQARLVISVIPGVVPAADTQVKVLAMKDHGGGRQTWTRPATAGVVNT